MREPKRYRVYLVTPAGTRIFWDDVDTEAEGVALGESTFLAFDVIDTETEQMRLDRG